MSNLSIFKISVGPSSSHTLGPLIMGHRFCEQIDGILGAVDRVQITLFGSLSLTGRGHLSDKAILWGLSGLEPKELNYSLQEEVNNRVLKDNILRLANKKDIAFEYKNDLIFSKEFLPLHENALKIEAFNKGKLLDSQIYYSIGGGFVATQDELENKKEERQELKLAINNAKDALSICTNKGYNLSKLSLEYELQFHSLEHIKEYCLEIWGLMQEVYNNGINPKDEFLPGALCLKRRAKGLSQRIQVTTDPMGIIDFISLYAIAIAEENASGMKVVSAPTNGACAVIPAVMLYLKNHTTGFNDEKAIEFLLSAMLIGSFYKKNASISGAEAGCQAEIGSASSMAAGAMASVLGASANIACNAAEIAMEHHLGLTCDPVGGLVQVPCIERNAFGAIKAISASRMAMSRKSTPIVALDDIIQTMYQTGKDMNQKYKETSLGGLAVMVKSMC